MTNNSTKLFEVSTFLDSTIERTPGSERFYPFYPCHCFSHRSLWMYEKLFKNFVDKNATMTAAMVLRSLIFSIDFIWFMINESRLKDMIQDFHSSSYRDNAIWERFDNLCLRVFKFYWTLNLVMITIAFVIHTVLSGRMNCIL